MNRARSFLLGLLAGCLALSVSAAPSGLTGDKAAARQVHALYNRWVLAFEKKDLAALMACYDKHVVFSMQGQPEMGLKGIKEGFEVDFKARGNGARWLPHIEQIYSSGALIVVVARWEYVDETSHGKADAPFRIRSVDILTPGADGLTILHTVNYPLDPPR